MARVVATRAGCLLLAALLMAQAVPAGMAAGGLARVPSFRDVHEQYMRVTLNESGFRSLSDQDGILSALLFDGGGRLPERAGRGTGYGLDYSKLMMRMVRHSPRTFPADSPLLRALSPARLAKATRLRTYQNKWASTVTLDCAEPDGWDEGRSGAWLGYVKRCAELVRSTEAFLKGRMESRCDGEITTWGSRDDREREGGAVVSDWVERRCDRQPAVATDPSIAECAALRAAKAGTPDATRLLNSTNCARNYFFSWLRSAGG